MTPEEKKAYRKEYREKNKDRIREQKNKYMKEYYAKNQDKIKAYQKSYYLENSDKVKERTSNWKKEHKEDVDAYNKKYRAEHSKEHNEYIKMRRQEDATYKMICSIRNLLNNAFNKRTNVGKHMRAEKILGCSIDFFVEYLQNQFEEGMTIENHGEWHIDHKIPLSSAKTKEDVIKLNHYTNLQPLWASDNYRKSGKMP